MEGETEELSRHRQGGRTNQQPGEDQDQTPQGMHAAGERVLRDRRPATLDQAAHPGEVVVGIVAEARDLGKVAQIQAQHHGKKRRRRDHHQRQGPEPRFDHA